MDKFVEVIEKIFGVLGYDIYDNFVKVYFDGHRKRIEFKMENEMLIKKKILESDNLSLEQKAEVNFILSKNLKAFMRELNILGIAIDNMDDDANVDNLDEDWLLDFFDKAAKLGNEYSQQLWAKMLSYAASNKEICSKSLLHSLFLMGREDILCFSSICKYTLVKMNANKDSDKIAAYPMIYFKRDAKSYNNHGITSFRLNNLQRLGLIEVNFSSEYVFSAKQMKLRYGNKLIEVECDDKIKIGNVRFTHDGYLLYQMTERTYEQRLVDAIIEIWGIRKYRIFINGKRVNI